MTTYEKIVKGATKLKVAAPKSKYIEPILMATSMSHQVLAENFNTIMRCLNQRLQDLSWSVVYKSLIVIHIMIREGDRDVTLEYLATKRPAMLNLSNLNILKSYTFNSDVRYVLKYAKYLQTRVRHFAETHIDYVRDERVNNLTNQLGGRLRNLPVEKGLLRECESVQTQIDALLKNSFLEGEIKNDIVLTAFRLLVNDLLALFQELNEGVINILEHYFEMFHNDAERALVVYKKFVDQTKYVIDFLRVAKHLEYATKLHVPTIKHAPTALTSSLEEYLNDPNFEQNRRQYLQDKQAKDGNMPRPELQAQVEAQAQQAQLLQNQAQAQAQAQAQKAQQVQQAQQAQQQFQLQQQQLQAQQQFQAQQTQQFQQNPQALQSTGLQRNGTLLVQQNTYNPWGNPTAPSSEVLNPVFTGAGFGGYGQQTGQTIPQAGQQVLQQTGTNPFLQQTGQQVQSQPTAQNGFGQVAPAAIIQNQFTGFHSQPSLQFQIQQQAPGLVPQVTSSLARSNTNPFSQLASNSTGTRASVSVNPTNPFGNTRFANNQTTAFSFQTDLIPEKVSVTATGSNPFKVSQSTTNVFNSASQSQAQQPALKPQPTAGGLEKLPTVAVFPQTQQEQARNALLDQAKANLYQQATGQIQQQWPAQQQATGQFQPQATGQFQQQQWPQQQQQFQPQSTQHHLYNGPSLI